MNKKLAEGYQEMRRSVKHYRPPLVVLAIIVGVGLLGLGLTLAGKAATYDATLEAESGTLLGNQGPGLTDGASGSSVKFGAANVPNPNPTPGTTADASDCTNTAADKLGWGAATYQSDFNNGTTLDPTWHPYGPESGHAGAGTRTPAAITQGGGNAVIRADGNGTTGAMKWFPGQKYGRWEVCMKVETGNQHYVLITWPDAEDYPVGGEIDFAEESGGAGRQTFFLHCPTSSGGNCDSASKDNDAKQWTAYALEWTPDHITGYINGQQYFNSTNKSFSPPRPMNLCIQLDYFGHGGADAMIVDWAKQWPVTGSQPSTLGLKPGEKATGHPGDASTKQYAPRPMTVRQMLGLDP
jgi:hypothetical protein